MVEFYEEHRDQFKIPERLRLRWIKTTTSSAAQRIYHQLLSGHDFATLAQKYSTDAETAAAGGELGLVDQNSYPEALTQILFSLPVGQTTPIVLFEDGQAIFKVDAHYSAETIPFSLIKTEIRSWLVQQAQEQGYQAWLANRLQTHLKTLPGILDQPLTLPMPRSKPLPHIKGIDPVDENQRHG